MFLSLVSLSNVQHKPSSCYSWLSGAQVKEKTCIAERCTPGIYIVLRKSLGVPVPQTKRIANLIVGALRFLGPDVMQSLFGVNFLFWPGEL